MQSKRPKTMRNGMIEIAISKTVVEDVHACSMVVVRKKILPRFFQSQRYSGECRFSGGR
jgi:hypothetical protein